MRIALEAKRLLGLPIDESDYAGLETKETKLRNVTNMENYVKNVASSYGRDSGAMMDEMLKLNGCESVAELQEKVANGESIIEAADTAWNAGIQKQHYAAYDAMIAARNAAANLMNLNASLRSAELGTHGDTNALWAKQNPQFIMQIPTWAKHTVDFSMTAPLAVGDAFPMKYPGVITPPVIGRTGSFILDAGIHTVADGLNWMGGNGDGTTFVANATSNLISSGAGLLAQAASAHAIGVVFGTAGSALGPAGTIGAYVVGFGVGAIVTSMGLNEPIEEWLRDPSKRKNQLQREEFRKSNTWTGVRG